MPETIYTRGKEIVTVGKRGVGKVGNQESRCIATIPLNDYSSFRNRLAECQNGASKKALLEYYAYKSPVQEDAVIVYINSRNDIVLAGACKFKRKRKEARGSLDEEEDVLKNISKK